MSDEIVTPGPPPAVVEADPKRPYKAWASAAMGAAAAFLAFWIGDDDPFTKKDAGEAALAGLGALVASGVVTFTVPNPLRSRTIR